MGRHWAIRWQETGAKDRHPEENRDGACNLADAGTATAAPPPPLPTLPDGATGSAVALPAPLYLLADQQLVRIDPPNRVIPVPLLAADHEEHEDHEDHEGK